MPSKMIQTEWNPRKNNPDALLIDTVEAAALLNICTKTLRKLAKEERVKSVRIGRRLLFTRSAIEEFINESERSGGGHE